MALLYQPSLIPAFDHNGRIISGAQLHFYLSGTTTKTSVFTSSDETAPHTNPVVANSAGRFPPVYLREKVIHRVRMTDAKGILLSYADVDPINAYDPRGPVIRYYRFGGYVIEAPIADELLVEHIVTDSFTLPADMAGSVASAESRPSVRWQMGVFSNGIQIGVVALLPNGEAAMTTRAREPIPIEEGDVISFVAPAVPDAELARVRFTLKGIV